MMKIKKNNNKILLRAPAKINLHLEVIGKREDHYHELSMIMQSIDLYDFLEIEENNRGAINLKSNCQELSLNEDNLIIKAASLLKDFSGNNKLGANIFLTKNIPIGAGLAGGSTDAAATLIGLNKLWKLNLDGKTLQSLASKLGSDIPFCLDGGFQFCFGKGEILEKYNFDLNLALILLKDPDLSISTADTYKKYSLKFCNDKLLDMDYVNKQRDFLKLNRINDFKSNNKFLIKNDLQKIVEEENPSVKKSLSLLSEFEDSLSFSMSGSGPSCFALFKNFNTADISLRKNNNYIKENGFDSWVCKFDKEGVKIIN